MNPREQKILDALSPIEWKRTMQIAEQTGVGLGNIYVNLNEFEKKGWVVKQYATLSEEELKRRGGNRAYEYKLTLAGYLRDEGKNED